MAHLVRRLLAVGAASALLWPVSLDAQARERVAYVSVVERASGQPLAELSPTDVIIREDGVRREVARLALTRLISDGRIHPTRIEEVVEKVKKDMEGWLV